MRFLMNQTTILVIDAGLGNIGSVVAALKNVVFSEVAKPPKEESASGFTHYSSGVGSFAAGMSFMLNRLGRMD